VRVCHVWYINDKLVAFKEDGTPIGDPDQYEPDHLIYDKVGAYSMTAAHLLMRESQEVGRVWHLKSNLK
jgi:hypothetical protein